MTLGMREGLIVLIVLVAAYILFVLLRMAHLRKSAVPAPEPRKEEVPPAGNTVRDAPPSSVTDEPESEPESVEEWAQAPTGLVDEVLRNSLEQELGQLRDELDAVRGELAALRADMHQELASLRASQTVSPIYGDAMQLAVSGYDAAAIAERCGIARAEADLVVALAKSQER